MAIRRTKRVDLEKYDPSWAGSFVIFYTKSHNDILTIQKDASRLSGLLETADPEEKSKIEKDLVDMNIEIVKSSFKSGMIVDDVDGLREMRIEDIDAFDFEVLNELVKTVIGGLA